MKIPDFKTAWAMSPFRSVFASVPPTAPMPPVGAAVFWHGEDAPDDESVRLWADMADDAARNGACFVLLSMGRSARDAAKAALAAELERRKAARVARCGTALR